MTQFLTSKDINLHIGFSNTDGTKPTEFYKMCVQSENLTPTSEFFTPPDECGDSRSSIQGRLVSEVTNGDISFSLAPSNYSDQIIGAALFDRAATPSETVTAGTFTARAGSDTMSTTNPAEIVEITPTTPIAVSFGDLLFFKNTLTSAVTPAFAISGVSQPNLLTRDHAISPTVDVASSSGWGFTMTTGPSKVTTEVDVSRTLKQGDIVSVSFVAYTDTGTADMHLDFFPDTLFQNIQTVTTTPQTFRVDGADLSLDPPELMRFFTTPGAGEVITVTDIVVVYGSKSRGYDDQVILASAASTVIEGNEANIQVLRPERFEMRNEDVFMWVLKDLNVEGNDQGISHQNFKVASFSLSHTVKEGITASVTLQGGQRVIKPDFLATLGETITPTLEDPAFAPAGDDATLYFTDPSVPIDAKAPFASADNRGVLKPFGTCIQAWGLEINNNLSDIECSHDTQPQGVYAGTAEVTFTFTATVDINSYDKLIKSEPNKNPVSLAYVIHNQNNTKTGIAGYAIVIKSAYLSLSDPSKKAGELVSLEVTATAHRTGEGEPVAIYSIPIL